MLWPPLQDEPSTLQLLKKHLVLEQTIEDYAETIGLLSQQCRQLLEMGHPDRSVLVPHKPVTTLLPRLSWDRKLVIAALK